jgi:hypothetical protein
LILKCENLISPETIQAYRETEFRVFVEDVMVLKISEKSEELVDLLKSHRSEACAFVTAFNPLGELLSCPSSNGLRQMG